MGQDYLTFLSIRIEPGYRMNSMFFISILIILGVAVGGLSCFLAGVFGSGGGTTSYSENIGAIGITKVDFYCVKSRKNNSTSQKLSIWIRDNRLINIWNNFATSMQSLGMTC